MITNAFEGGTVHKLPENHEERQLWIQSSPNQSNSLQITNNSPICYKHFLLDCPRKKIPRGAIVQRVAPTIFGVMQTATPTRKLLLLLRNSEHKLQKHMIKIWIVESFLQSF